MSKVDAMRAMREARYAARTGAGGTRATSAVKPSAGSGEQPAAAATRRPASASVTATRAEKSASPASVAPVDPAADAPGEALCGHRSMNGRSCRRPAGHAEKNHRYS